MMLNIIFRILLLSLLINGNSFVISKFPDDPIQWSGGSINWPCESVKSIYTSLNKYIRKNVIATRIAIYNDDAIVALPRYRSGIPITLAKIPLRNKNGCPTLNAFPSWEQQEEGNCDALQSIVDISLDSQNILWVLDTGIINSLEDPVRTCSPKVVGYYAKTGKLVKSIDLSRLTSTCSRLQYVIADCTADKRVFLYITDAAAGAILVYDATSNRGHRILLPIQIIDDAKRDVLHPILVRRSDGLAHLLFSYLSSKRLYSIPTKYLQKGDAQEYILDVGTKSKKIIFLGTDCGSTVFFRYEAKPDIYRWDATTPFINKNFELISSSNDDYSLATQVISDHRQRRMRVLQSNFPDYIEGSVGCGVDHSLKLL